MEPNHLDLRMWVDLRKCAGPGTCAAISPEMYHLDPIDGMARGVDHFGTNKSGDSEEQAVIIPEEYLEDGLEGGLECPVECVMFIKGDGTPVSLEAIERILER